MKSCAVLVVLIGLILSLAPADFSRLLGYADPTGDLAVAHILERTAA